MNGYALATKIVHYSQGPDFSTIKELISDKIHAAAADRSSTDEYWRVRDDPSGGLLFDYAGGVYYVD